jgi:preprotein translocase subunit YajC
MKNYLTNVNIAYNESVAGMRQKLKKGNKVLTAAGDIQTVLRTNKDGNIETEECEYSWSKYNLKKVN